MNRKAFPTTRRTLDRVVATALLILIAASATAQDSPTETLPKGYLCTKAGTPVAIDGSLDDSDWSRAPWTDDFVDIEGDRKPKPRFRTRAKMLWDDQYFYIAAELTEQHVWGTLTKHDSVIFHDNDFEVFIDPDGDNHEYYEFEMNALNTGWDLFLKKPYRDGGPALNEWEIPGLKTAVKVQGTLNNPSDTDRSWTLEIAFPWKVLAKFAHRSAPPRVGDHWRVNFSRVEWEHMIEGGSYKKVPKRREDNWVWSPQGVIDMHRPERWGFVQFVEGNPSALTFQPDPTYPIRAQLMRIYHAQRTYYEENKAWAKDLGQLGIRSTTTVPGASPVEIRTNDKGDYEANFQVQGTDRRLSGVWTLHSDSRISHAPSR